MELYREVRPNKLKNIVGNKETIQALERYLDKGKLPHCILLTGPTGCGKTTIARILAKELGVNPEFGLQELDASIFRGIDTARDIGKETKFRPIKGQAKLIVIDEAHVFGQGGASEKNLSQNALLKTLENCPDWCYFVLCTTNPEMLLPTLRGRCTQFQMKTLTKAQMKKLIVKVSKKKKKKLPGTVIEQVIESAQGHPRNALQILSKVLILDDIDSMLEVSKEKSDEKSQVNELAYALLDGKSWRSVAKILKGLKDTPPETIRRGLLGMMQSALVNGWGDHKSVNPWYIMSWFYDKATYDSGMSGIVFCCKAICDELEGPY